MKLKFPQPIFAALLLLLAPTVFAQPFVHPGCLHTLADLDRMKAKVAAGAHPWFDGFIILTNTGYAQLSYNPNPQVTVTRNSAGGNFATLANDCAAAYQHALIYNINGDTNHANKAVQIMDAWSGTLTSLAGDSNAQLLQIQGHQFAAAAELMRNYSGWAATNFSRFTNMMFTLWIPGATDFIDRHNGTCVSHYWANWDLASLTSMAAIGVLCDNRTLYNQALDYFKSGYGNGNIEQSVYFLHPGYFGQGEEMGRDQGHAALDVAQLGALCQIAQGQGDDLFGYENNRVLALCEHYARYNLGSDVPYFSFNNCENNYQPGVSPAGRGNGRPTWDLIYNHYANGKGVAAPWSAQFAAVMRPEGGGGNYGGGGGLDQLGFTTLTSSLDPIAPNTPPTGLTATSSGASFVLSWWGTPYGTNYNVKRATVSGGPYTTIGNVTTNLMTFTDTNLVSGATYFYAISALSAAGESANAAEAKVVVLPVPMVYLKFNEASGTMAADDTGNGWNGTLMNGATFTASGHSNNAVNLNGTTNYVSLPTNLTASLSDFTIATWVNLTSVAAWARIFDFGVANNAYVPTPVRYMFLTPQGGSGVVRFAITVGGGNAEQQINGTAALPTGWHHVAVTRSGTNGVLYVDGLPVGANTLNIAPSQLGTTTQNTLGRSQFGGDPYLNGRVDDFRIYSGALSAAQISALVASYPFAPAAPTNVTATAIFASQILLTWNAVATATTYVVKRSTTNGGPYAIIATGVTATNYTDTALIGSMTYYYEVTALNHGGSSTNSIQVSATTLAPPNPPTGLNATGVFGGQIVLSWTASAGATSYNVKYSYVSGGPYVTIVSAVASTSFTNTGLTLGATYYFVVSAVNANGEGPNSAEANALVPIPTAVWQGNVSTNWDISTTTNWLVSGSPGTYLDGSKTVFNDTAIATNLNLAASVSPYSMQFSNSAKNFTLNTANNSSIGGATTLTKWGGGSVALNNTNTFTGGMTINAGSVTVGGTGVLGGGNYPGNVVNFGTLNFNSSAPQSLSGVISQNGAVNKNGSGTLTLSGANTYSGNTTLNGGSVVLQDFGSVKSSFLLIGNTSGSNAAVYQAGSSTLVTPGTSLGALQVGSTSGGFGYYNLSAGTLQLGSEMNVGGSSGGAGTFGQFDMTGGNLVMANSSSSYFLPNRGVAGEASVVNFSGGTVSISGGGTPAINGANGFAANWSGSGAGQTNTTTVSGTGNFLTPSLNATLNVGGNAANAANLNLNGGMFQVKSIFAVAGASRLNFNGGTLKAGNVGGLFFSGGAVQAATLFSCGATIDDNGQSIVIDQSLLAPNGSGVATIPMTSGGAGYVVPPRVFITSASGSGATAHAGISNGVVTGITVTCRGTGYASAPTVSLSGGGFSSAAVLGTPTISANTGGGLTKIGSGTVTLGGSNTYTGPTTVGAGMLKLGGPLLYLSFDNTNGTTVVNGGSGGVALNGTLTGAGAAIVAGGRVGKALSIGTNAVNTSYVLVNDPVVNFNNSGAWTWGMWLKSTNAGGAYLSQGSGSWVSGNTTFYLNQGNTTSGTKGGGVRSNQGWQTGTTYVSDGNWHFVAMTCNNGTKVFYVDGAVDAWTANFWSGNGLGNQLWVGGTTDTGDGCAPLNGLIDEVYVYGRALSQSEVANLMNGITTTTTSPALPATTALTVASGATLALNNVSAQTVGSLAGGNSSSVLLGSGTNATMFTFGNSSNTIFAGTISGNGSVTKTGSGTTTIAGANTYTGATVISNGTVNFGQSGNTNYVASLGPVLKLTFDQIGRTLLVTNDSDGSVTTNLDSSIVNTGAGGQAMDGALIGAAATIVGGGRYGNALSVSGGSYLYIGDKVAPLDGDANGASWTYALWIKTATAGATYGYQGDGTWSGGATTFYLNNNNGSAGGTKPGGVRNSDAWLTGTTALNDNAWHFVAITVNAGIKTIYVDGTVNAQTGTTGWANAGTTAANQFWIGASPDTGDGVVSMNGLVDEVYLFNRALSQSEVQNLKSNQTVVALGVITGMLPAMSPVSLALSATLDLTGTFQTVASFADAGGSGGVVTNSSVISSALTLNAATTNTFTGPIRGSINLTKSGSGTQALNGANAYTGNTTVNAGTLAFGLATLPTNATVRVAGGAVLSLNFPGTNRVAGIVLNGASQSPGVYNAANSAPYITGTGSLQIGTPVATNPTNITASVSGGTLTLSWPADQLGWRLLRQTNHLAAGISVDSNDWATVFNSQLTNQITVPVEATFPVDFYRLIYP